jgi:hypothetical protein
MATTDRAKELTELLKGYTTEAIVTFTANRLPDSLEVLLANRELAQRDAHHARSEQHELDLKLIAEQVRWMKFTAILGAVTTIIGTILGVLLTIWLQRDPPIKQQEIGNAQLSSNPAHRHRAIIKKAESVPSKPPESK